MVTRILLIVAIVLGLGVIAISQFKVRPHIQAIIEKRDLNEKNWKQEEALRKKRDKELADTKGKLDETTKSLEDTQTQLASTRTQLDGEQKRANTLQRDLIRNKEELKTAQQDLEAWRLLELKVDQVKAVIASEKKMRAANEALEEEKKLLVNKVSKLQREIDEIVGNKEIDPPMPAGLRGTVKVVDPKWNFVVLDVGEKQGVVPRGVFLVSRNSKLVAKVRVMSIQGDRSIANIVPGWKLDEIMEGDQVIY